MVGLGFKGHCFQVFWAQLLVLYRFLNSTFPVKPQKQKRQQNTKAQKQQPNSPLKTKKQRYAYNY
jgi:hypothetical protein